MAELATARPPEALGQSEAFLHFQERLSQAAKVNRPVLLVGERGTGKELAAARLHYLSPRWEGPMMALNCAALSPSLMEAELFGYEAGAFTGATGRRSGRFESADGGTLFLDEIGLIPLLAQEKILRVVEYGSFERVGGTEPVSVDVRIIGATNLDLRKLAESGKFKSDLLDRLCFEVLFLPPLRERREDILYLAGHFARRMAVELGLETVPDLSPTAVSQLEHYHWPGNIRELKNVIERAVYRAEGEEIARIDFDPFASPFATHLEEALEREGDDPAPGGKERAVAALDSGRHAERVGTGYRLGEQPLTNAVRDLELAAMREALAASKYHQRKAAEVLGLTYHQFRGLYRKYQDELGGMDR